MKLDLPQHCQLLLQALIDPNCLDQYSSAEWELLIRLARRVKLLARLALIVKERNLWDTAPPRITTQLTSALVQVEKLQQLCHWELNRILWVLEDTDTPIIALKGIAYGLMGLPYAKGRLSVDLDLLVPETDLADIESLLMIKGWKHRQISAYDEHYYRAWSHEIPPLIHTDRETEVDIHHTLMPVTTRIKMDTTLLFAAATPVKYSKISLLSSVDMVIHCAINLFQNNEIANDLRDLLDLHDLMTYFSDQDKDFWLRLIDRANQLKVSHLMYYGLYFSQLIFKTPIPEKTSSRLHSKPGKLKQRVMHQLVPLALFPQNPDNTLPSASLSRLLLFFRSHIIRMPLYPLIPHLIYKIIHRCF